MSVCNNKDAYEINQQFELYINCRILQKNINISTKNINIINM